MPHVEPHRASHRVPGKGWGRVLRYWRFRDPSPFGVSIYRRSGGGVLSSSSSAAVAAAARLESPREDSVDADLLPPPVLRDDAPVRRAATDDDDRVRVSVVLVSRTPAIAPIRGLWRRRPGPPASPSPSSSSSITKALSATMALPVNASEFRSAASGSPFSFRSFPRCCLQSLAGHTLSTQTDWHFQRQI